MMFMSVRGMKDMTEKDKKNSIKKTLNSLSDRLDITENSELHTKISNFIQNM